MVENLQGSVPFHMYDMKSATQVALPSILHLWLCLFLFSYTDLTGWAITRDVSLLPWPTLPSCVSEWAVNVPKPGRWFQVWKPVPREPRALWNGVYDNTFSISYRSPGRSWAGGKDALDPTWRALLLNDGILYIALGWTLCSGFRHRRVSPCNSPSECQTTGAPWLMV